MTIYAQSVMDTALWLRERTQILPEFGILTGTGLGDAVSFLEDTEIFDYKQIPGFPVSTVESHAGRLVFGRRGNARVVAMQGRFHLYEGYGPLEVTFPVRVMKELGVQVLILSNAAGGLNPAYTPGDIMLIRDHINLTGENPLVGPNESRWGVRFPDMSRAWDQQLRQVVLSIGNQAGIAMQEGVYVGLKGPSLETPAEVRYLQLIGAEAVGFSTVQEAIVGVHSGMRILGLSTITNVHNPDQPEPATVEEIIAVAEAAVPKMETLITTFMEQYTTHGA